MTGRRTRTGNRVSRRGIAKKKGGIGLRCTGRTIRTFKPNIHTVRLLTPWGAIVRMKLSARAIKGGTVSMQHKGQTVHFPLMRALRGSNREFSKAQAKG
jgi:large subunit ribosomal protein L28